MGSQRLSTALKMVMGLGHFLRYGSGLDLSLTKKCQKLLLNSRECELHSAQCSTEIWETVVGGHWVEKLRLVIPERTDLCNTESSPSGAMIFFFF